MSRILRALAALGNWALDRNDRAVCRLSRELGGDDD